jgi:hypothetical protein
MTDEKTTNEMMRSLGAIESKQDLILLFVQKQHDRINEQEKRIGALERGRAWLIGAAAAAGVAAQYFCPFR